MLEASPERLAAEEHLGAAAAFPFDHRVLLMVELDGERIKLSDELVTKAQSTAARIRFIENADLLSEVGGVGALLRFKI